MGCLKSFFGALGMVFFLFFILPFAATVILPYVGFLVVGIIVVVVGVSLAKVFFGYKD